MRNAPNLFALRRSRTDILAAALLLVVCWLVYSPALNRVFADDQLMYFAELGGSTSLSDGLRLSDYAASRHYWKGDDALFRPLLFVWLAIGNTLLTYHHLWWNMASLLTHVFVAFFLFRLLNAIHPSPFALAGAVLFAVMKPGMELVVWNHLIGYMLAWFFYIVALTMLVQNDAPSRSSMSLAAYALVFTAAVLSHESMVPACVAAGIFIVVRAKKHGTPLTGGQTALLLTPLGVFLILYGFHAARVERISYVDRADSSTVFSPRRVVMMPILTARTLKIWAAEMMIPSGVSFSTPSFHRGTLDFRFSQRSKTQTANLLLSLVMIILILSSLSWRHIKARLALISFLAVSVIAYVVILCVGRTQSEVVGISYYVYFFGLVLVVLGYVLVDTRRLQGWRASMVWVAVVSFGVVHGIGTHNVAEQIGRANEKASAYFLHIEKAVDEHKAEAGFTFAIEGPRPDVDPDFTLVEGYPDRPRRIEHKRISAILFARYLANEQPRYRLDTEGNMNKVAGTNTP
jgi:hypothetical protein